MDQNMQNDMGGKCEGGHCKCNCMHHKIVPGAIALIAVTFLLGDFGVFSASTVALIWPILLLIAAGTKMNRGMCKCC